MNGPKFSKKKILIIFINGPKFSNIEIKLIFAIHDKKILASDQNCLLVIRLNDTRTCDQGN